jgi:hypothetical protein
LQEASGREVLSNYWQAEKYSRYSKGLEMVCSAITQVLRLISTRLYKSSNSGSTIRAALHHNKAQKKNIQILDLFNNVSGAFANTSGKNAPIIFAIYFSIFACDNSMATAGIFIKVDIYYTLNAIYLFVRISVKIRK